MEAVALQQDTILTTKPQYEGKVVSLFRSGEKRTSSTDNFQVGNTIIDRNQYEDYYTSQYSIKYTELGNNVFSFVKESDLKVKTLRTHYTQKILSCLDWLSENHSSEMSYISVNFISKLQISIKEFISKSSSDPFASFLLSIYDGLTFDNAWINMQQSTFEAMSKYIKELNNQNIDYKKVDKYISKLEKLNINVLPY